MNKVRARMSISIYANCPQCDSLIDLMDPDDTQGVDLNECGHLIKQACPSGCWMDAHEHFKCDGVKCCDCGHVFDVKELEW